MVDRYEIVPNPIRRTRFQPAFNPELGIEMAINGAFGGTADPIHNGTDTPEYTGSSIVGNKITFDSTDSFPGWPAEGTKSIKADKPLAGDIWQFARASSIDLTNFIAFSMKVFVTTGWTLGNSVKVYGYDTVLDQQVGNSILIENFINEQNINVSQTVAIPLVVMGLETSTIDAIRIEVVAKTGSGIVFYADMLQIEETSGSRAYAIVAPTGTLFSISSLNFTYIDAVDSTLVSSSMPKLDYNSLLSVPKLFNGITFTLVREGVIVFDSTVTCLADHTKGGSKVFNVFGDANGSHMSINTGFDDPVELDSRTNDILGIIINDDLTGLVSFTALATGFTVNV